ncbi:unnamed protein product [Anisakis simplex]|uniref:TFIIIC_sub6 domain-containing protein n=1 Tax=Anisakis simplex TaxID=6269 RepID=A0A0M3JRC6_ANISI|nr:unnamed protein product [Anisakis simplex]
MDVAYTQSAIGTHDCSVRRANTGAPLVQISNALYTAQWEFANGSDMILRCDCSDSGLVSAQQQQLVPIGASDVRLVAEKALVTPKD